MKIQYVSASTRAQKRSIAPIQATINQVSPQMINLSHPEYESYQEILSEYTTGNDIIYKLTYKPIYAAILSVYINGILQRRSIDYKLIDQEIVFTEVIPEGFNIIAQYIYMKMIK